MSKIHAPSSSQDLMTHRFSGKAALIFAQDAHSWKLERTLEGSHSDVIRCILWDPEVVSKYAFTFTPSDIWDLQHSVIVSGGEDSRLSTWPISATITNGTADLDGESMQVDEGELEPLGQKKRGRDTSPSMEDGLVKATTRRRIG